MPQRDPRGERVDESLEKPDIAAILAPVVERWEEEDSKAADGTDEPSTGTKSTAHDVATQTADVLEGVDKPLRDALRAAGYGTLTAIAEVEPLDLSRTTGRTYSEACRVRFLAKRALEEGVQEVDESPREETSSPLAQSTTDAPPTASSDTILEAERALRELSARMGPKSDRFSPAHPESPLPQDCADGESDGDEGPGGPFA